MGAELQIGKVAKSAGVNLQTVRYYERRGLLAPQRRTPSGYRLYTDAAVDKIRFIKNAQSLGFTLKETGQLLRLRVRKGADCAAIKKKAVERLADVRNKIAGLAALEKVLHKLVGSCRKGMTTGECPVLDSLDADAPPVGRIKKKKRGSSHEK